MSNFNQLYRTLTESNVPSIFRAATRKELKERRLKYANVRMDEWMSAFEKRKDKRLVDGRWDVDGNVNLSNMGFTKIPVKFGKVHGSFHCANCTSLTSLEGAPKSITGGSFSCGRCTSLTSLEGAPGSVTGGSFYCHGCTSLTSLEGAPTSITGGWFHCSDCTSLTSLEGAPGSVIGDFYCSDCGRKFTVDEVREHCKVTGKIYV